MVYSLWFNFAHITVETKEKYLYNGGNTKLEVQITKEYKDRLFRLVFGERRIWLALYNAVKRKRLFQPGAACDRDAGKHALSEGEK